MIRLLLYLVLVWQRSPVADRYKRSCRVVYHGCNSKDCINRNQFKIKEEKIMINKSTMDKIIKINEQRERDMNPLYCLGRRLLDGDGVEQDKSLGMEVIRTVAEQGNVDAQYELGRDLLYGWYTKQDESAGVEWMRKAAEQGNEDAQCEFGSCLLEARGIKQDIDEGVKWLKMAAENGSKEAKKKLFYISCGH